jgi:hypothetical protein
MRVSVLVLQPTDFTTASIRWEESMSAVEYFRVGARTHAILLAEDLLSTSYLDTGNRGFFGCPIRGWVPQNMTGIGQRSDQGAGRAWARIWALTDPPRYIARGD